MLRKPRRGWWVLPGGKVEVSETWPEAVTREMQEETGLSVSGLELCGIHRIRIANEAGEYKERLIAQFFAGVVSGQMLSECKEGKVETVSLDDWEALPMDGGDRIIIRHSLYTHDYRNHNVLTQRDERDGWLPDEIGNAHTRKTANVYFGKFTYTQDHALVDWDMSPKVPVLNQQTCS